MAGDRRNGKKEDKREDKKPAEKKQPEKKTTSKTEVKSGTKPPTRQARGPSRWGDSRDDRAVASSSSSSSRSAVATVEHPKPSVPVPRVSSLDREALKVADQRQQAGRELRQWKLAEQQRLEAQRWDQARLK